MAELHEVTRLPHNLDKIGAAPSFTTVADPYTQVLHRRNEQTLKVGYNIGFTAVVMTFEQQAFYIERFANAT